MAALGSAGPAFAGPSAARLPRRGLVSSLRMHSIFLTVGSQMPFDRLTLAVARWAQGRSDLRVQAQTGRSRLGTRDTAGISCVLTLSPAEYLRAYRQADLIIAHAGMGSILTALELGRPLVVMPRRGHLKETRNDHQFDTALQLIQLGTAGVAEQSVASGSGSDQRLWVALDDGVLPDLLNSVLDQMAREGSPAPDGAQSVAPLVSPARQQLVMELQAVIQTRLPSQTALPSGIAPDQSVRR